MHNVLHGVESGRDRHQGRTPGRGNALVTNLDNLVQVREGLVLIKLSHAQFFHQKFFYVFKLTNLLADLLDFLVFLFLLQLVVLALLVFDDALAFDLHVDELPLALVDGVPLPALAVVVRLFLANPFFKQLFFLVDHDSLEPDSALLELQA